METAELKRWAWEQLDKWGTLQNPGTKDERHMPWSFAERMTKADELVLWVLTAPKSPTDPAQDPPSSPP